MFETMAKMALKILLALGAVFAVLFFLRYLDEQRADYIEIYDDDLDEEFD